MFGHAELCIVKGGITTPNSQALEALLSKLVLTWWPSGNHLEKKKAASNNLGGCFEGLGLEIFSYFLFFEFPPLT